MTIAKSSLKRIHNEPWKTKTLKQIFLLCFMVKSINRIKVDNILAQIIKYPKSLKQTQKGRQKHG